MSRQSLDYQSLRADLRADAAAEQVRQVSTDGVDYLRSLYVIPTAERRDNLLSLAEAVLASPQSLTPHLRVAVGYYATCREPMPAFGRLLVAVRDTDGNEVDKALDRLAGDAA